MKIAILGIRGIPARYGGFETAAEEISVGLVSKGYKVNVYCRYGNITGNPKSYKGVKLIYIPHIDSKNIGTLSHTFLSLLHAIFQKYNVILAFNVGIVPLCIIPKLFNIRILLNVDGLEWKRRKWGLFAKLYFQFCEFIAPILVTNIITDSRAIQNYYFQKYRTSSTYISYGANSGKSINPKLLENYQIDRGNYFLVLSRLEPENNADLIIKAFKKVHSDKKLIIIGGVSYKSKYVRNLKKIIDSRILFFDPIYDEKILREFFCNCYAYIHGNEVGGTNPALLKAMGYGNCILSFDTPYNKEVLGENGIYFSTEKQLTKIIKNINDNQIIIKQLGISAQNRIKKNYLWSNTINKYIQLIKKIRSHNENITYK